ncbi:MAG TPA: acyl-ACP thioesterase domain-containing protein [Acidimicrobiales bacterium]|jgi:acyl-ACP thioesterase
MTAVEFVALSQEGRRFSEEFAVRLGDVDESGTLRLDGAVRFLQDVASDDWTDTGIDAEETWVVRRTMLRLVAGATWPRYLDRVRLTTWCGGVGAAWAERRTNIDVDGATVVEGVGLWVPLGASGSVVRVRDSFFSVYGESARARKVSGRVETPPVSERAQRQPWTLRRADIDILGHVNNAALWQAVSEVITTPVSFVSVTHHQPVEGGDEVTLAMVPGALWLLVGDVIKVSATYVV